MVGYRLHTQREAYFDPPLDRHTPYFKKFLVPLNDPHIYDLLR